MNIRRLTIKELKMENFASLPDKKAHVVVMFEPAAPGEQLTPWGQVNEVFGPFRDGEEAEAWSARAEQLIKNRHYLIISLSAPGVLNGLDPANG